MTRFGSVVLALLVATGCGDAPPEAGPVGTSEVDFAAVERAYDACLDGAVDEGVASLDSVLAQSPGAPDALVARGLCRWARSEDREALDDVQAAYDDLTSAIEAVEAGTPARGSALDEIYSHRAFVAQTLDDGWVRTLEDLDQAVTLEPDEPRHILDRGVVRSYLGDTLAARSDLEQYLVLADSFEVSDPARRAVVERLLEDLTPARTAAR